MPKRKPGGGTAEFIKTVVYAVVIAVVVRTVAFEPFNIPSGSMVPTLLIGDYVFVSKFSYGYSRYSMPLSPDLFSGRIFYREPQRGDVAVFRLPRDPSVDYIKRIIGLPGDTVQMKDGQLYINGKEVARKADGGYLYTGDGPAVEARRYTETLPNGVAHHILKFGDDEPLDNTPLYKVPPGHIFAMGDNRDDSEDSRVMDAVGFVPIENLVGHAEMVFFSVDATHPWWEIWYWPFEIRWGRLLTVIH
jgi:signal peptidase I